MKSGCHLPISRSICLILVTGDLCSSHIKNDKLRCLDSGSLQSPEPGIDNSGGMLLLAKCCGRRVFNAFQDATRWPVAVVQLCQHLEHIQAACGLAKEKQTIYVSIEVQPQEPCLAAAVLWSLRGGERASSHSPAPRRVFWGSLGL